jgi:NhaA family Na+:H+ antiporter
MKSEHLLHGAGLSHAPGHKAAAHRANPSPRVWHFAVEYLLALPVGAGVALAWANLAPESYFRMAGGLAFGVNDVAMALFFGWITKEIVEAALPGGVLHSWRRTAMPIAASAGLVIVPVLVYGAAVRIFTEPMLERAWPVAAATDLAAGYFLARVIFGKSAAVPFFLLLAMSADAVGFGLLAAFGSLRDVRLDIAVPMMTAAIGLAFVLRTNGVKSFWPYVLAGGSLSWSALYFGGFHPAFALLPIVPFLPHGRRDPGFFVDTRPTARDALSRFELWCRHPAQVALLLFGLVNGGVPLRALESGVFSLPLATLVGKPVGLLLGVALALAAGLHLPRHMGWRHLIVLGCISSIGFTLALFFATATLGPGQLLSETKMGALLSVIGAGIAIAAAKLLRVGRFAPADR